MSLRASDGGRVCAWIEENLVHGAGDWYGRPFRLTEEQRRLVWRIYEREGGRRAYNRVLVGRPKGYGKTELAAALALVELAGPLAPLAPDIPVAAASFEQADRVFAAARAMVAEGPLEPYLETFENQILRRDGPGRMYRVAAIAGTIDGGGHSFRVCDELHEWEGRKERVHLVLTNGLAKRRDSWALDISTAGSDTETLLGRLYAKGRALETGELTDDRFLFDWLEHPDPNCDLSTEQAVWDAVKISYRGAGAHVDLEQIVARRYEIPEYEWRRYYLDQFTATAEMWLPTGAWASRTNPARTVQPGEQIVLGFDGSYNNDSTALVGCTLDGHLFVVGVWEKPERGEGWTVPRDEVNAAVDRALKRWKVRQLFCDPPGWHREIDEWSDRYGGGTVTVMFPTNRRSLMSEACSRFYTATIGGELSHDGNPALARHIANAVVKESTEGAYITKEHRASPRKIDLAVAAVVAFWGAATQKPKRTAVYTANPW